MNKLAYRQIIDVTVSALVILFSSVIGLLIGTIMDANWQEKQWAMLYGITFIGSMSAFFCLIKVSQILRILVDLKSNDE